MPRDKRNSTCRQHMNCKKLLPELIENLKIFHSNFAKVYLHGRPYSTTFYLKQITAEYGQTWHQYTAQTYPVSPASVDGSIFFLIPDVFQCFTRFHTSCTLVSYTSLQYSPLQHLQCLTFPNYNPSLYIHLPDQL